MRLRAMEVASVILAAFSGAYAYTAANRKVVEAQRLAFDDDPILQMDPNFSTSMDARHANLADGHFPGSTRRPANVLRLVNERAMHEVDLDKQEQVDILRKERSMESLNDDHEAHGLFGNGAFARHLFIPRARYPGPNSRRAYGQAP